MTAEAYKNGGDHLVDELRWLDALLFLRTAGFRERLLAAPEPRGAYVSHEEVDWLLGDGAPAAVPADMRQELVAFEAQVEARVGRSLRAGVALPLIQLCERFGLSPFERRAVVVCLGPELDRRYDKLYAYLQDDIARKRPSAALVLDLLCDERTERWAARPLLTSQGRLLRLGVLEQVGDPESPSGSSDLARFLSLTPRVLDFVLGGQGPEQRLGDVLSAGAPQGRRGEGGATRVLGGAVSRGSPFVVHLYGPPGVGRRALAQTTCDELGLSLVCLHVPSLLRRSGEFEKLLRLGFREASLTRAAVYLDDGDALFGDDYRDLLGAIARAAADYRSLVFLAGERAHARPRELGELPFHGVELALPDAPQRAAAWHESLESHHAPEAWSIELGSRFRLTPGRIRAAVASASLELQAHGDGAQLAMSDLMRAARRESRNRLGDLAVQIEPRASWGTWSCPRTGSRSSTRSARRCATSTRCSTTGASRSESAGRGASACSSPVRPAPARRWRSR